MGPRSEAGLRGRAFLLLPGDESLYTRSHDQAKTLSNFDDFIVPGHKTNRMLMHSKPSFLTLSGTTAFCSLLPGAQYVEDACMVLDVIDWND